MAFNFGHFGMQQQNPLGNPAASLTSGQTRPGVPAKPPFTPRPGPPDPYAAFSSGADRPNPPNKPPAYGNPGGPGGGWFQPPNPFERRQPPGQTRPPEYGNPGDKFGGRHTMPGQPSPGLGGVGNQMQPMPGHGFQNPGFGGNPAAGGPPNSWGPSWGMRQPGMPGGFPGFGGGQQPNPWGNVEDAQAAWERGEFYTAGGTAPEDWEMFHGSPWGQRPGGGQQPGMPGGQRPPVNTMPGNPSPGLGNVRMQPAPWVGGRTQPTDRMEMPMQRFQPPTPPNQGQPWGWRTPWGG